MRSTFEKFSFENKTQMDTKYNQTRCLFNFHQTKILFTLSIILAKVEEQTCMQK